jgi:pyruvate/2-oxoglutarate/acetoin dehydrogenase E1 component
MPEITLVQAVNLALARAMADDPSVLVVGEDVGAEGGVFRATEGLLDRFGADRVLDTPLAEGLIAGMSVGLAAQGFRPVSEIQFTGFIYPTIDQLVNHASGFVPVRAAGSAARWSCARLMAPGSAPSNTIPKARRRCSSTFRA